MSRRRKGQRKGGGRVTPRGDAARFRPGTTEVSGVPSIGGVGGRFDAPPPITGLFDPLANHLIPSRDDHPAEVERLACELVGLTRSIADDEPMPGGPASSRPSELTGMAPTEDAEAMLTSAVLALAESQQFRPEARYVDCIRPMLPFCAPGAQSDLLRRVNLLESKIGAPQWADAVWNATSVGGWRGWDDLGDLDTIGLELSWPGNWENQVLFASIVVQDGPFVQEFVVTTIDEYRRVFTPGTPWPVGPDEPPCRADVIRHLEPLEPAEAAGRISHAIDLTEMMIDAPVSDDSYLFVPLARQILSGQPSVAPPDPIEASHDQREQLILEFLNADGVAATLGLEDDPGSSQQIGEFCELFIDYSEGYAGGDIHRWSPMVVEGFLHFYGVKVMSDPDTDELLEPVLTEWIAYCHRLKGWPESVTVEALEVFDQHYECAIDPDAQDAITPMVDLIRLAVEMGIDLEDPISVRELLATWDPAQVGATAEPWPADGAAEMMWDLVPAKAVPHCESVLAMAEPVLDDLFSPDHLTSARRMLADLAERHTQPFLRGRPDVWAASITYAVAQVHSAFDSTGRIFGFDEKLAPQQLVDAFPTVSKASMTNKATTVRAWLNADGSGRFRYNRTAAMLGGVSPPGERH